MISHILNLWLLSFCPLVPGLTSSSDQIRPIWISSFSINSKTAVQYLYLLLQIHFCYTAEYNQRSKSHHNHRLSLQSKWGITQSIDIWGEKKNGSHFILLPTTISDIIFVSSHFSLLVLAEVYHFHLSSQRTWFWCHWLLPNFQFHWFLHYLSSLFIFSDYHRFIFSSFSSFLSWKLKLW